MGNKMRAVVFLCVAFIAVVMVPADELKDLSSADVATPALSDKPESKVAKEQEESDLGETTGFGGGLVTSGSFSMMASGGMEEYAVPKSTAFTSSMSRKGGPCIHVI